MNRNMQVRRNQQLGYNVEFLPTNVMRISIPSLSKEFFNRDQPASSPGVVANRLNRDLGQRYLALHLAKIMDFSTVTWPLYTTDPDEMVNFYVLNYKIEINPSAYLLKTPKFPLLIDSSLNFVRRTSRSMRHELRHSEMTPAYAVSTLVDVNVDPETRKPKPIPDWWKQKYDPLHSRPQNSENTAPQAKTSLKPQNSVFLQEHRVNFSDIDDNGHTTFSTYIRMCLDSVYEVASSHGQDDDVLQVALQGRVGKIHIVFKSDCKLGDILGVEFWKDDVLRNSFHFEIKNSSNVIATAAITFHQPLNESKL